MLLNIVMVCYIVAVNATKAKGRGLWLAQPVEHVTLNLRVVNLSPMLGMKPTLKKKLGEKAACNYASIYSA